MTETETSAASTATATKDTNYKTKQIPIIRFRRFFVEEPIQEPAQAPVPIIIPTPLPISFPGDESEPAPVPRTDVD